MSGFQFRLKGVQQIRERLRDKAAEAMKAAAMAIETLQSEIDSRRTEIASQSRNQVDSSVGLINTQRVLDSQRYQLYLLSEIQKLQEKIDLIRQELERRRATLVQREQDVKALEKLKANQLQQWEYQQAVRQQSRLDEWASFRFWQSAHTQSDQAMQIDKVSWSESEAPEGDSLAPARDSSA
jgi:flagellar FliJ protein